jgi:hypothetical protein
LITTLLAGRDLDMMCARAALRHELADLFPDFCPSSDGVDQSAQAEHYAGTFGLPAHAGGTKALLDCGRLR